MIKYQRKAVVQFLALQKYFSLDSSKALETLRDEIPDISVAQVWKKDNADFLIEILEHQFYGVTNEYIKEKLVEHIGINNFDIIGDQEEMYQCQCCGYMSLTEYGEYDICSNCFWEDDGTHEADSFSSANKMTLTEARRNYDEFGSVNEESLAFIDPEARKKFQKA